MTRLLAEFQAGRAARSLGPAGQRISAHARRTPRDGRRRHRADAVSDAWPASISACTPTATRRVKFPGPSASRSATAPAAASIWPASRTSAKPASTCNSAPTTARVGHHGFVTDLIRPVVEQSPWPCRIVCCGPEAMMEATAKIAQELGVPCEVSLESPMACGIGICFSCVKKIRDASGGWDYRRTCVEGPVFNGADVEF